MNAESLELQAIFNSDHLVCSLVISGPLASKVCRGFSDKIGAHLGYPGCRPWPLNRI